MEINQIGNDIKEKLENHLKNDDFINLIKKFSPWQITEIKKIIDNSMEASCTTIDNIFLEEEEFLELYRFRTI